MERLIFIFASVSLANVGARVENWQEVKEDRKKTRKCLLCCRPLILGASQEFYHEREFQKVDDITVLVDAVIAFNILSYEMFPASLFPVSVILTIQMPEPRHSWYQHSD